MIRINLIGKRVRVKEKVWKGQIFIYIGLVVLESAFLVGWYLKLSSDLQEARKRVKDATAKIEELTRVKAAWEKWQAEKADIDRQAQIFEKLKADQLGPPAMLQFLSYALTKVPDIPENSDEIRVQELAGWNPRWDTKRLWLKRITEKEGEVTIEGEAIDHEDVAEFYRRLESSGYFSHIAPGLQARKVNQELNLKLVEFIGTARLNYKIEAESPLSEILKMEEEQKKAKEVVAPSGQPTEIGGQQTSK